MSKSEIGGGQASKWVGRILGRKAAPAQTVSVTASDYAQSVSAPVDEAMTRFDRHPAFERMQMARQLAQHLGAHNPFFRVHDAVAGAHTSMGGVQYLNFSNYNYLDLAGHPEVNAAAVEAIGRYGTSASASRLVAGERPIQRELERALADVYGAEDCAVFVSGHATNVSTIGCLFGPRDLIVHDSLIHNSVLQGIQLSGAARRSFPHNDCAALDRLLTELRSSYERVLIVVEGLYSMDGDFPDLPALVALKSRHGALLMVDEAHSLGVLGASGLGLHEHFGVSGSGVDIWMGTLSKTLAGCGGYVAGNAALIDILKYSASGFVYSVGLSPVLAAASLTALRIMRREPERVATLHERGRALLYGLQALGLDSGYAQGFSVVPAILGGSLKATNLSGQLLEYRINVQPIIHPAVDEKSARLRFFISSAHSEADIQTVCAALAKLLK